MTVLERLTRLMGLGFLDCLEDDFCAFFFGHWRPSFTCFFIQYFRRKQSKFRGVNGRNARHRGRRAVNFKGHDAQEMQSVGGMFVAAPAVMPARRFKGKNVVFFIVIDSSYKTPQRRFFAPGIQFKMVGGESTAHDNVRRLFAVGDKFSQ